MFYKLFTCASLSTTIVLSSFLATAKAASFDCKKARSVIEVLICADPILSTQDSEMGMLYKAQLSGADAATKSLLTSEQRQFNKSRANACQIPMVPDLSEAASNAIIECLKKHYTKRISQLTKATSLEPSKPVQQGEVLEKEKSTTAPLDAGVLESNAISETAASTCDHKPTKKKYFIAVCSLSLARQYGHNDIAEKELAAAKELRLQLACTNTEDKALLKQAGSSAIHIKNSKAISSLMDMQDAIHIECKKASKDLE